jgi:2-C-methyl-D-erythritol 4-phosphate cytidylyltransferase/2-C-methyl-D-erythritol 2,4-cyclodiphosphate synthase
MFVTAIIAAGGWGRRLGAGVPKQLLQVGGATILERSVGAFASHPGVAEVVVALPATLAADPPGWLAALGGGSRVRVVAGGERRQDSVANAFDAIAAEAEIVLVHDAARPFVTADVISRSIEGAAAHGAAIAAVGAQDTVKRVEGGAIAETLPRESIVLAQTPQAFRRGVLRDAVALGRSGVQATDEAALAERAGHRVHVIDGDPANVKITTSHDLEAARGRARDVEAQAGIGYDLHRLVEGRPLVLGGVTVPSDRGALGHSDADVVCHAVTDAVLGAAHAGDIGRLFPDSDPRWKDASSLGLLREAVAVAHRLGFAVRNVDVVVILERPKLAPYRDAIERHVADALGIEPERVSVKAKTNEGMDAVGRGEAIAAHAVAIVSRGRSRTAPTP